MVIRKSPTRQFSSCVSTTCRSLLRGYRIFGPKSRPRLPAWARACELPARDEKQVRPLLPASPGSLVIITSRNQLGGLAAGYRARLLALDVFSHDEAVDMLTGRIAQSCGISPVARSLCIGCA